MEIAKQTGAKVKGITLSENQFATASRRAQEEGISDKVSFQIQDYRDEKFAIVTLEQAIVSAKEGNHKK